MNQSLQHNSATTAGVVSEHNSRTALILGGGGSTGNAWLIGIVAGLVEAGLDVTKADLIIGTSAGSERGPVPIRPTTNHMETTSAIIATSQDAADMRRRMGAAALETDAESDGSAQTQWRATVATRLPGQLWPQQRILITAVDARTGEPVVFDNHGGVELVDAVAASCSSRFAYSIGGGRYIDGGYRSNADNADLAAGYARVLVLSPFGGRSRTPVDWGMHLTTQIDELRTRGSRVETVFPDSDSEHMLATTRWTCRCAPPLPEPATTKAEPSPIGSPNSGADA